MKTGFQRVSPMEQSLYTVAPRDPGHYTMSQQPSHYTASWERSRDREVRPLFTVRAPDCEQPMPELIKPAEARDHGEGPTGFLEIWLLRVLIFYGCLFTAFSLLCTDVAAAPQHVLLYTRIAGMFDVWRSFQLFMAYSWRMCFDAILAQVLFSYMTGVLTSERPLANSRKRISQLLRVKVWVLDAGLTASWAMLCVVHNRIIRPGTSSLVSLFAGTWIFACLAASVHLTVYLFKQYRGIWQRRNGPLGGFCQIPLQAYNGLRIMLVILILQVVYVLAMALHPRAVFMLLNLPLLLGLMLAFHSIFHGLITTKSHLTCFSIFVWVCTIGFLLSVLSTLLEVLAKPVALTCDPNDPQCTTALLTGGTNWQGHFSSPSAQADLASYPVCRMFWGSIGTGLGTWLSSLDIAVFSAVMYYDEVPMITSVVQQAFQGTELEGVQVLHIQPKNEVARLGHFRLPSAKVDIIAVRGSTILSDWMYNAYIWAPGMLWHILMDMVLPFGNLIPTKVGTYMLSDDMFTIAPYGSPAAPFFTNVKRMVERARSDGFKPILTGHSLGGGMAQTAGAIFEVQVLAISPVGMSYSTGRFGLNLDSPETRDNPVENNVVSIVPHGDVVPELEPQLGMVQLIHCSAHPSFKYVGECHQVWRSMCEIFRKCGDRRGRTPVICQRLLSPGWDTVPFQDAPQ